MREVKRKAKTGEYIKIVTPLYTFNRMGDILFVSDGDYRNCVGVRASDHPRPTTSTGDDMWPYNEYQYVVLEGYNHLEESVKIKEEKNMFNFDNLIIGDVVEFKNGYKYAVMPQSEHFKDSYSRDGKPILVRLDEEVWGELCEYNFKDVAKVYRRHYSATLPCKSTNFSQWDVVYEYKEVKKMTVAEISKALGYDVEVIKG